MRRTICALFVLTATAAAQQPKQAPARTYARIAEIEVRLDAAEDPPAVLPFGPHRLNHLGFLRLIRRAAKDKNLDAVLLKVKRYRVGWARLLEVRKALRELRRSGKKVFFFKESLATPDLVLASFADRVSMPESGMVALPGLAIESLYMREMLAKLHLRFDVVHIGEYKTAGESLVRDSMSKELKETLDPILDELFSSMVDVLATGRGLKPDVVRKAIDQGLLSAAQAKEIGLIDAVEYYDRFKDAIKSAFPGRKLKWAEDYSGESGPKIDTSNPMALMSLVLGSLFTPHREAAFNGPEIAVIYCTGQITSGKSKYGWTGDVASMGSKTIVKAIDKARKDRNVKAIVLRVNSPGGSALASDVIWRAVQRARSVKPVVASMGDVAASGGYYISMGANKIVAEPQTITGSIGVLGIIPNVDDFFAWVGLHPERLTRGKHAGGLLTTRGLDDADKQLLKEQLQAIYTQFVAKAAAGRGKTPAEIDTIARGRVWTGRAALERGLIDKLGGLETALALARELGRIPADATEGEDYKIIESPRRAGPFEALEDLFDMRVSAAAAQLGIDQLFLHRFPALRRALEQLAGLQAISRDRVCVVAPELAGLAHPFAGR